MPESIIRFSCLFAFFFILKFARRVNIKCWVLDLHTRGVSNVSSSVWINQTVPDWMRHEIKRLLLSIFTLFMGGLLTSNMSRLIHFLFHATTYSSSRRFSCSRIECTFEIRFWSSFTFCQLTLNFLTQNRFLCSFLQITETIVNSRRIQRSM